ncbi:MAG TPA: hypothetical protein VGF99_18695, partial [Myxococcota bacterium]
MRHVVVGTALLVVGCAGTPVSTAREAPPVFTVEVDEQGEKGSRCHVELVKRRGARPETSDVIATVVISADKPAPLEAFDQLLVVQARRRCADGFAMLQAAMDDGANGYVDATAELWAYPPPAPSRTAADLVDE